jgi:hypothetical protein
MAPSRRLRSTEGARLTRTERSPLPPTRRPSRPPATMAALPRRAPNLPLRRTSSRLPAIRRQVRGAVQADAGPRDSGLRPGLGGRRDRGRDGWRGRASAASAGLARVLFGVPQNKNYSCAIGSLSAGSQTRSWPSGFTSASAVRGGAQGHVAAVQPRLGRSLADCLRNRSLPARRPAGWPVSLPLSPPSKRGSRSRRPGGQARPFSQPKSRPAES